jgi:soluble lytic murein transglycosylase
MQIMPDEAARIATVAGLGAITREQLFDPKTNIAVGAAEIRQKIDAMDGKQILGIASYNAGEAAVGRWIAKTALDDDVDVFVESIPYAETRLYVKNVTRNLFEYRRIYGSP